MNLIKNNSSNYRKYVIIEILKTDNNCSIKCWRWLMMLPTVSAKLWIYQVLSFYCQFGTTHQSRTKFLIGNFTGDLNMNLIAGWESSSVNEQIRQKIDVIEQKWELFRKRKTISQKYFFEEKKSNKTMKCLQNKSIYTRFSYHRLP